MNDRRYWSHWWDDRYWSHELQQIPLETGAMNDKTDTGATNGRRYWSHERPTGTGDTANDRRCWSHRTRRQILEPRTTGTAADWSHKRQIVVLETQIQEQTGATNDR